MIIVTGGAGFIGSATIWELNNAGYKDILVVDDQEDGENSDNLKNRAFTSYMDKKDFIAKVRNRRLEGKVEGIIHMGACSSTTEQDKAYLEENNLKYTKDLALWALENSCRFIYASSAATYGDGKNGFDDDIEGLEKLKPLNLYGWSKQNFDLWAKKEGVLDQMVGLKFFNVYGPNEYHKESMKSVACKAFKEIKDSGKLRLFKSYREDYQNGEQCRDFVYIKDCTKIILWLLENPEVTGLYNIGSGTAESWNTLAKACFNALSLEKNIDYIEMPENIREHYQYHTEARMTKLSATGYTNPMTALESGVEDYFKNYLLQKEPYL